MKKPGANELALLACNKKPPIPPGTDVYIAGEHSGGYSTVAGYYKNGIFIRVADDTLVNSEAYGLVVAGNDVYVAGAEPAPGSKNFKAVYWKNGVSHFLDYGCGNGYSTANDIAVVGNDVYVIGDYTDLNTHHTSGIIWKNGIAHNLDFNGYQTGARGLAVKGGDIYISGYSSGSNSAYTTATIWENGVPKRLTNSGVSWANLYAITLDGNDVYVAGYTAPDPNGLETAVYWKNGIKHFLGNNAFPSDIIFNDNKVYAVGTQIFEPDNIITQATYWINNPQTFTNANTQKFFGIKGGDYAAYEGRCIAISGNNLYMTAYQMPDLYLFINRMPIKIAKDAGYGKLVVVHH
ncbi:MAG TPA: hypothetical protein VHC47_08355 [Mucilaginibacter sp.]|nr:hypothetical protein [Mucilaginibacter sp.]